VDAKAGQKLETDEVKAADDQKEAPAPDICVIELGGTVGGTSLLVGRSPFPVLCVCYSLPALLSTSSPRCLSSCHCVLSLTILCLSPPPPTPCLIITTTTTTATTTTTTASATAPQSTHRHRVQSVHRGAAPVPVPRGRRELLQCPRESGTTAGCGRRTEDQAHTAQRAHGAWSGTQPGCDRVPQLGSAHRRHQAQDQHVLSRESRVCARLP
jgi:hypothetical protein